MRTRLLRHYTRWWTAWTLACLTLIAAPNAIRAQQSDTPDSASGTPGTGVLRGSVSDGSGAISKLLPHVWVRVVGARKAAVTDSGGAYVITDLPAGTDAVAVQRLGYRPLVLEVRIPPGDTVSLDVELETEPVALTGLTVRASPLASVLPLRHRERVLPDIDLRALEAGPGFAETGIGEAARSLGGEGGGDPAQVLLMRGSTTDQKLMLLDGAPVHAPFHLGGLLPSFNADLLSSARHYVGGAPARYDGGLSYVLDLHTRPGRSDGPHGSAFLDLLGGGATLEGPLSRRATLLASGRALHELGHPVLGTGESPFGYREGLLRGDLALSRDHHVSLTGFWNVEHVRLDLGDAVEQASGELGSAALELARPEEARWGNGSLSVRYRGAWGESDVDATVAGNRYRAALPLGREDPAFGRARTRWIRAQTAITRKVGSWTVQLGASGERIDLVTEARALVADAVSQAVARSRSESLAAHVEGGRDLGEAFHIRGALRLDHFPGAGGARLAPRLALGWSLSEAAELTVSAGRFFQLPSGSEMESGVTLADPAGLEAGRALYPPAQATHVVLSLAQRLAPELQLGLDGFVKGFRDLPGAGGRVVRSSGLDLRIRRSGDDLGGWLGYSLAWFWSPEPIGTIGAEGTGGGGGAGDGGSAGFGGSGAAEFAGRHLLSGGIDGRIGSGWRAALQVSYGDGLPYTSVPLFTADSDSGDGAPLSSGGGEEGRGQTPTASTPESRIPTLDGFLRVDFEVSGEWEISWGGRSGHLRPYVRVLNAVSRRDALFHYFEPWRSSEVRALAERPLLPLVGAEIRF